VVGLLSEIIPELPTMGEFTGENQTSASLIARASNSRNHFHEKNGEKRQGIDDHRGRPLVS